MAEPTRDEILAGHISNAMIALNRAIVDAGMAGMEVKVVAHQQPPYMWPRVVVRCRRVQDVIPVVMEKADVVGG